MKKLNFILSILAILAITISIVAICTSLKVFNIGSTAYLGLAVATLSTLVLVLIGWNIYTVIDVRSIKDEIDNKINQLIKVKGDEIKSEIKIRYENKSKELDIDITKLKARFIQEYEFDYYQKFVFDYSIRYGIMSLNILL